MINLIYIEPYIGLYFQFHAILESFRIIIRIDMKTNYFEPWLCYQHPIVRQLAFCIASPNILQQPPDELAIKNHFELHDQAFWQQQFFQYQNRLNVLDQNPSELIEFVKKLKSTRLGLRFEYLFWFWLQDQANQQFELIQHSIQIIEGKNTIGEMDFLVRNLETQHIEHWEVALKYYLGESDLSLVHWYGLNRSDTLNRKLRHFSEKQFQFTHALDFKIDKKIAVMKGQLYIPSFQRTEHYPTWINQARRVGHWGYEIQNYLYRLQRHEWICPNMEQTSPTAHWWSNGLYHDKLTQEFYMFRQAPFLASTNLLCK